MNTASSASVDTVLRPSTSTDGSWLTLIILNQASGLTVPGCVCRFVFPLLLLLTRLEKKKSGLLEFVVCVFLYDREARHRRCSRDTCRTRCMRHRTCCVR